MRIPSRKPQYLYLLVGLVLTAIGVTVGLRHESPKERASQPAASPPRDWKEQLAVRAASHFSPPQDGLGDFRALRAPAFIPSPIRRQMERSLGPHATRLGISLRDGYFLKATKGTGLWVVKGKRVVCIFNGHTLAVACDTAADTARYGLVVVSGPSPQFYRHPPVEALGIAPDGIKAVRLEVIGGANHVVPITDNTFAMRAHRPIAVKGIIRERGAD